MASTSRSLAARYGMAILTVAVALLLRLLLDPLLGNSLPFLIPCLAVVVVAWHGGWGPSLAANLLSLFAAAYLFLTPRHDLAASLAAHPALAGGYLFLGVSIGVFSEALRIARRRAEDNARETDRRRQELEEEVARGKRLEQELQRQAVQLADADRRKDEFLATLAHELRNPLAPLRNALELLRRADDNRTLIERARAMMERQVGQLVRLVDDLLDIARITRGKLQLRKERVELASVVRSAVEAVRPAVEAQGHKLTVTLPPQSVPLDADPVRLAQVVSNLLLNAAKYTEQGGRIALTAQVSREHERPEVVVTVRDTGIGIAAEHLPHLFEMFSQVTSALERSQGGLGIGLSLVRGLVELHGGSVAARSDGLGTGSEFIVRLPVAAAGAKLPPEPGQNGRSGRSCRILVVDDNRDAADSLAMMLRLMGHDIQTAYDGLEAVETAASFRPEVVLLDIGLPKMNGYDAARHIRASRGASTWPSSP